MCRSAFQLFAIYINCSACHRLCLVNSSHVQLATFAHLLLVNRPNVLSIQVLPSPLGSSGLAELNIYKSKALATLNHS